MNQFGFENGARVAITDPDAPPDGFSERERDCIDREVAAQLFSAQSEVLRRVLFLLLEARKPKRRIYQLLYACGMGAACGGSASSIAKRLGISKQAFEQSAERDLASLDMRKNALEKKPDAAGTYAKSNFRRSESEDPLELL